MKKLKRNRKFGFRLINIGGRVNNQISIVLLIQILVFYLYPLLPMLTDPMGMVLSIVLITFILSVVLGVISKEKIKYIYPIVISLLFIPTVFIYYNSSALIHSLWYLIVSYVGLFIGISISKLKIKR